MSRAMIASLMANGYNSIRACDPLDAGVLSAFYVDARRSSEDARLCQRRGFRLAGGRRGVCGRQPVDSAAGAGDP
ncbi:protein of unknown function [Pseudomonas sp. JV241A]|nr:protein of unknown function [Pseudomonas sp. JV241A]